MCFWVWGATHRFALLRIFISSNIRTIGKYIIYLGSWSHSQQGPHIKISNRHKRSIPNGFCQMMIKVWKYLYLALVVLQGCCNQKEGQHWTHSAVSPTHNHVHSVHPLIAGLCTGVPSCQCAFPPLLHFEDYVLFHPLDIFVKLLLM